MEFVLPFDSLSIESYELNFCPRLILGPVHPNQVMESDPVNSHHGTWTDQSCDQLISIIQLKTRTIIHMMAPIAIDLGLKNRFCAVWWGSSPPSPHYGLLTLRIGARGLGSYQNTMMS